MDPLNRYPPDAGTLNSKEHEAFTTSDGARRSVIYFVDGSDYVRVSSANPLPTTGAGGGGGGTEFDDGDALDTTSQGTLIIGTTAIPGTARAIRVDDDGAVHVADGGNSLTVDGPLTDAELRATAVPVSGTVTGNPTRPSTATLNNVSGTASSTTLLASNANRLGAMIQNESTALLYVKFGTTASATSYTVRLGPNAYFEFPQPVYTGRVDGIWSAAAGDARVTELTA